MTAIEALLIYLAFTDKLTRTINIYQVAIEPHVRNLIDFLNSVGADIHLNVDHSIVIKPSKIDVQSKEFKIISDYIEAGTYFAIGAGADDSELFIK